MEQAPQLDTNTEVLLQILNTIRWEDGFEFKFNQIDFHLIISTDEEMREDPDSFGEPAWFAQSTITDGYDIYLHDTIPEANRKRVLFHEIMEANLRHNNVAIDEAHQRVLAEEERVFGKRE